MIIKDIKGAIDILNDKNTSNEYKKVNIFSKYSLKHFKKYKLENREVLTKINSMDEVFDLLSYDANLTCFSENKLDEYFLKLLLEVHKLNRKDYLSFVYKDANKKRNRFSREIYDEIKNNLDSKVREFFDEIYKYSKNKYIPIYNLVEKQLYSKENYEIYIRHILTNRYSFIKKYDINYIPKDEIDNTFNFINLSYDIDKLDYKKLLELIKSYSKLLKENGKIQSFVSRSDIDIEDHIRYETRSITDSKSSNDTCKKD